LILRIAVLAFALLVTPALAQDIRVIDGDTFEMDGEIIRLWGIDAPELDQTCEQDGEVVYPGEMATEMLTERLLEFEYCDTVDTDRYGRTIARCFTTEVEGLGRGEINSMMVMLGGAWDYPRYSGGEFQLAEMVAGIREYGVWSGDCIPPWEWRRQ